MQDINHQDPPPHKTVVSIPNRGGRKSGGHSENSLSDQDTEGGASTFRSVELGFTGGYRESTD